jgi:hypothetical protein
MERLDSSNGNTNEEILDVDEDDDEDDGILVTGTIQR